MFLVTVLNVFRNNTAKYFVSEVEWLMLCTIFPGALSAFLDTLKKLVLKSPA